jgi:DNA-binding transcriptional ArsR family regulator
MAKFPIGQLADLLTSLGERALSAQKPDLRAALGLVSDIGRITISGDERDVRATQSAVGALRQRLRGGEHVKSTPATYLHSVDSPVFLAGAMWALSDVLDRRLEAIGEQRAHGRHNTRKEQVEHLISDALIRDEAVSPSDLLSSTLEDGTTVRRDELSRAFSALNDKGLVHVVSGDQGRKKFFALTPAGKDAMKGLVSHAWR